MTEERRGRRSKTVNDDVATVATTERRRTRRPTIKLSSGHVAEINITFHNADAFKHFLAENRLSPQRTRSVEDASLKLEEMDKGEARKRAGRAGGLAKKRNAEMKQMAEMLSDMIDRKLTERERKRSE